MKSFSFILAVAAILSSTSQAKTVTIDGQQSNFRFQEVSTVYKTEYRYEDRQSTCSREVVDGYEESCDWEGGGTVCRTVGGGQSCGLTPSGRQCFDLPSHEECSTEPSRQVCRSVPRYRTEYYSCTRTEKVPYQVKDYDVENDIIVTVERQERPVKGLADVIDISGSGSDVAIRSVRSSGKVLLIANKQTQEVSNNGAFRRFQTNVTIKIVDRLSAISAFAKPASELTGDINGLEITTAAIADLRLFKVELDLRRNKFLGKDEVIFQRALTENEMQVITEKGNSTLKISLQNLGVADRISGKKAKIELRIQSIFDLNSVVNKQDLPADLSISKRLEKRLE